MMPIVRVMNGVVAAVVVMVVPVAIVVKTAMFVFPFLFIMTFGPPMVLFLPALVPTGRLLIVVAVRHGRGPWDEQRRREQPPYNYRFYVFHINSLLLRVLVRFH